MGTAETVNMHEAKTHLSRLVASVEKGNEVIIAKAGKPVARMVPIEAPVPTKSERTFGWLAGKYRVPDDIKKPFAKDIEEMFYGE